jgi:hypothetical protein
MVEVAPQATQAEAPISAVHVFWGHAKIRDPRRPRCEGAKEMSSRHVARPVEAARTYFGMPLCEGCWDDWWRAEGNEGQVDPSFDAIQHPSTGEWLAWA